MTKQTDYEKALFGASLIVKYWESLTGVRIRAFTPHLSVWDVSASSYTEARYKILENRYIRAYEKVFHVWQQSKRVARKLFKDRKLAQLLVPEYDDAPDYIPLVTQLRRLLRGEDPGGPEGDWRAFSLLDIEGLDLSDLAPDIISLEDAEREFVGRSESEEMALSLGCTWKRSGRDPED